jgi:hypothetical protein
MLVNFRRWAPLSLVAAGAIFVSAGCSSAAHSANAAEAVRQASQNSSEASTASFEMTIEMKGIPSLDEMKMSAEGVLDFDARQSSMTMNVLGQKSKAVSDGRSVYVQVPVLGGGWYKTTVEGPLLSEGTNGFQDPTQMLQWLAKVGNDVERVGSEKLKGSQTEHYRATLSLKKALEQFPAGEQRDALEATTDLLGGDELVVDVWIGSNKLPAKLSYEMSFANSTVKQLKGVTTNFTIEYFDWGEAVHIALPDPKDVKELGSAFGG